MAPAELGPAIKFNLFQISKKLVPLFCFSRDVFFITENFLFFLHCKVKNAGNYLSDNHTNTERDDDKQQSLPEVEW